MFEGLKAGRLIEALLESADWESPAAQKSLKALRDMGSKSLQRVLQEMRDGPSLEYNKYVPLLSRIITDLNIQAIFDHMADSPEPMRIQLLVALAQGKHYNPNKLLRLFESEKAPKPELIKAVRLHAKSIDANALLRLVSAQDRYLWDELFAILQQAANESLLPNMATHLRTNPDPVFRMHMVRLIARFDGPQSAQMLAEILQDENKNIASIAMQALYKSEASFDVRPLVHFLRGAGGEHAEMATELLMRQNDPKTGLYLSTLLLDGDEEVRLRAVHIMARMSDSRTIGMALGAIKDGDWWLKERAIKALKSVDDPRLARAMVALLKDENEFVRQTAIEIADTGSSESFDMLAKSLNDEDWLVQLRAIHALGKSGDKRAVPLLIDTAKQNAKSSPEVLKALGALGDPSALPLCIALLEAKELTIQREAIQAIELLVNKEKAEAVRRALNKQLPKMHHGAQSAATVLVKDITKRFGLSAVPDVISELTMLGEDIDESVRQELKQGGVAENLERSNSNRDLIDPGRLKQGDVWQNRYEMQRKIGKGAWGTVWLAEDTMVGEPVVLKFMNPELALDKDAQKRFIRELRYARKVTSANVIRIFDFLAFDDGTAISMEYFDSHSLMEEIHQANGPVPVDRVLSVIRKVAVGMAAAHHENVIHRDLKPANILVNGDVVKVVDFGIAAVTRSVESTLTKAGSIVGTPVYVSPEQVLGKELDHRTDIYSLGIIMYQMLAGKPPYEGEPMSLLYQHVHGGATPLNEVNPLVSVEITQLVAGMMSIKRDQRVSAMGDLIQRIDALS